MVLVASLPRTPLACTQQNSAPKRKGHLVALTLLQATREEETNTTTPLPPLVGGLVPLVVELSVVPFPRRGPVVELSVELLVELPGELPPTVLLSLELPAGTVLLVELSTAGGTVELFPGAVELSTGVVELPTGAVELSTGTVELLTGTVELFVVVLSGTTGAVAFPATTVSFPV